MTRFRLKAKRRKNRRTKRQTNTRKQRGGGEDRGVEGLAFWLMDNVPKRTTSSTTDIGMMPYSLTEIRVVIQKLVAFLKSEGVDVTDIQKQFDTLFALPTTLKNQRGGGPDPEPPIEGWISLILLFAFIVTVLRTQQRLSLFNRYITGNLPVISSSMSIVVRIAGGEQLVAHGFTCLAIGSSIASLRINGTFMCRVIEVRDILTYAGFLGGVAAPIAGFANNWWMTEIAYQQIPVILVRYNEFREELGELNTFLLALYSLLR
jgi:hypothetical protein